MTSFVRRLFGRIGTRLLVVNLIVLVVPLAGLEFARLYERQLLGSLERDMHNQAALTKAFLETLTAVDGREALTEPAVERTLRRAAATTRTRIRLIDESGVIADSHKDGPPEGLERLTPDVFPAESALRSIRSEGGGLPWPVVEDREEVRRALAGAPATRTRVRERAPAVFLFIAEPVRSRGEVIAAVYITRSTQPVLAELYRIRTGLLQVLGVALLGTVSVTLLLSLSISRPLVKLSKAAKRVAHGELAVEIPRAGSGEIRELADAFASMKERLAERLTYISELSADVAHEFKSPLTSIRGAAEILSDEVFDDPAAKARFLSNILLDVDRLDRLVVRLLELSRIEASQAVPRAFDLVAMAERVAKRCSSVDEPVIVELEAPRAELAVVGREEDIETALLNLVDNALRHSPTKEEAGSTVRILLGRGGKRVRITVVDQGEGIVAENLSKVWDRFFTTDVERGGTGLGLAIVRAIAEAHGGEASCESEVGKGSRFTITLSS